MRIRGSHQTLLLFVHTTPSCSDSNPKESRFGRTIQYLAKGYEPAVRGLAPQTSWELSMQLSGRCLQPRIIASFVAARFGVVETGAALCSAVRVRKVGVYP